MLRKITLLFTITISLVFISCCEEPNVVQKNNAPVVSNITLKGSTMLGGTLTVLYDYYDPEGDAQDTPLFQWYRADNPSGLNAVPIGSTAKETFGTLTNVITNSYIITLADLGKYVGVGITPAATNGKKYGTEVKVGTFATVAVNNAPIANNVTQTGSIYVGSVLTASYTYSDLESDSEGITRYQWYRSESASGSTATAIAGATAKTYTTTTQDVDKYVGVGITPVATQGVSLGIETKANTFIGIRINNAPVVTNITITGTTKIGDVLTASYTYSDAEADPEGTTQYQWYRADDTNGTNATAISGATAKTYTLTTADVNKYIGVGITPLATQGTSTGIEVKLMPFIKRGGFTYVPDYSFEVALIDLGYDTVLDDYVLTANINTITTLDLSRRLIVSSVGIEDFIALTKLYFHNNLLTNLDITKNTLLTELTLQSNYVPYLDVTKNTLLTRLDCRSNYTLSCIRVNATQQANIPANWSKDTNTNYNTSCP